MYFLTKFKCKNFIGLYNGLGKTTLELDFSAYTDKSLFVILGENARGKSTLLSILHPFPGTTDKRDQFIREDKEGYKELTYEKTEEHIEIFIRIVYVPNKSGSHSTKCFITKTIGGDTIDLNQNGNVSSFMTAVENEFGIAEDFLRLSTQNENMAGLVKMTSANRKDHIYNFIPKSDDTLVYQKVVSRKYRDVNICLSSIVDKLGKMEDEVTIRTKLKDVETRINELVEKRDKHIGKITAYKSQIETLDPDDSIFDRYKSIKRELNELSNTKDKLISKHARFIQENTVFESIISTNIDSHIDNELRMKAATSDEIIRLSTALSSKKQLKANIYDSISDKKHLVEQLTGSRSIDDLNELLAEYRSKLSKYDSRLKSLNTILTSAELIRGIDVLADLRTFLYDIYNTADSSKNLIEACNMISSIKLTNEYESLKSKLETIRSDIDKLTSSISTLDDNTTVETKERPLACMVDDCPLLEDYNHFKEVELRIITLQSQLRVLSDQRDSYTARLEQLTDVYILKTKLDTILAFYNNNLSLLSNLPFNDKYATQTKLLQTIMNYDALVGVENNFYEIIEILQDKDEYDNLRNVKIPLLISELEKLKDSTTIVDTLHSEIDLLTRRYDDIVTEIKADEEILKMHEINIVMIDKNHSTLLSLKELLSSIEYNNSNIDLLTEKFNRIKEASEHIENLNEEIQERHDKLKVVDAKLKPLTDERDFYKYQENKVCEYNKEKIILEENLQILTLIRNALSVNKGMPVDILKMYVDTIRRSANTLLSQTFDGTMYLEKFVITDKEFVIPMLHNGEKPKDVSFGSSSEKCFISTCLSLAIIEQILSNYGVLNLDEVDGGMSEANRRIYAKILIKQMTRIGINQAFLATHSRECYEQYENEVCFILFPGHTLNTNGKDFIKVA